MKISFLQKNVKKNNFSLDFLAGRRWSYYGATAGILIIARNRQFCQDFLRKKIYKKFSQNRLTRYGQ